jgi:hypothetical protein
MNSPKGILGSGGDRSSAHDGVPFFLKLGDGESILRWSSGGDRSSARDGVPFFLKLGDGESILRWSSGSSKTTSSILLVSSSSS